MKKLKTQKGITLVALIITIVVLLILAAVAIGTVRDSDIIGYSKNAATDYETKQEEEKGLIEGYEMLLGEQQGIGPWKVQEDGTIKNAKTGETKKIGDTFTNDEVLAATGGTKSSYTGTWTILGIEKGGLKLVSTTNVGKQLTIGKDDQNAPENLKEIFDKAGAATSLDFEKAIWSYQNVVNTLNKHAQDATGIISARSITLEDLEAEDVLNITNDKKVGLFADYGKTYNYFYNADQLKVLSKNKLPGSEEWSTVTTSSYTSEVFVDKEGKVVLVDSEDDEVTLDCNYYSAYTFTDEQKIKYNNSLANGSYWLASPCAYCITSLGSVDFRVRRVRDGIISNGDLFSSGGYAGSCADSVRAVVYI